MWTLSGFADEIDPDLDKQCAVLNDLGIKYIEFRSAWDINVLDLDDEQIERGRRHSGIPRPSRSPPSGRRSARSTSRTTSTSTWPGWTAPSLSRND